MTSPERFMSKELEALTALQLAKRCAEVLPYRPTLAERDLQQLSKAFIVQADTLASETARADRLVEALEREGARVAALEAALTQIAAFDDGLANDMLGARGSYGGFDEPGSVQIAREALAAHALVQPPNRPTSPHPTDEERN